MPRLLPPAPGLAILRIAFGLYWLVQGSDKIFRMQYVSSPRGMIAFIRPQLARSEPFYRHFLQTTVLPNAATFAPLVGIGEFASAFPSCSACSCRSGRWSPSG